MKTDVARNEGDEEEGKGLDSPKVMGLNNIMLNIKMNNEIKWIQSEYN